MANMLVSASVKVPKIDKNTYWRSEFFTTMDETELENGQKWRKMLAEFQAFALNT